MVSFSASPQGAKLFQPASPTFAGRKHRHGNELKTPPIPMQTDFPDLKALGDALDSESEAMPDSMVDSFCSTTSKNSVRSNNSYRMSLRGIRSDDVLQVLGWLGFRERAQKGSHHQLVSPNLHRSLTIPAHSGSRHPIASGTMHSILNQMEEILDEEQAGLNDADGWLLVNQDALRSWVNDPKSNRQEIQAFGKSLQQPDPKQSGSHKKRAATF